MKKCSKAKALLALLLTFLVAFSGIPAIYASAPQNSAMLDAVNAGSPTDLGSPFPGQAAYPLMSGVTYRGDTPLLCTVSGGSPSLLNIVDMSNRTSGKVIETYEVYVGQVWANVVDSKGRYCFAGFEDGGRFYRYDPNAPEGERLEDLGASLRGSVTAITLDEHDNLYFTNSRTGEIIKYDNAKGEFISFGVPMEAPEYPRSLAYYDGYLYGGGQADGAHFFRMNVETQEVEYLEDTPTPNDAPIKSYYTMKVIRDYLFCHVQTNGAGRPDVYL